MGAVGAYLTISVRAGAIAVEAIVDETAVTLGEECVALLHEHAVVAVDGLADVILKLGLVTSS